MKEVDLTGVLILTFLLGGMFTGLGLIMKTQNAGDMLNGFDYNKYDKEKTSKEVGNVFYKTGLVITLIGLSALVIDETYYNYINISQIALVFIGIGLMWYKLETKCKIE
ncbi:MAG: DUF3784 domain-containing protein [Sarcina sp.]